MRRLATVFSFAVVVLLAPLVATVVGAWANGWTVASVTTGSMRPGIEPGAMVVLAPVSPADVEPGDVIGFRDERIEAVVTHRVVDVLEQPTGRFFTTQGDANPRPDGPPVPAAAVVGEVRWRVAGLGSVAEAMRDHRVQVALVAVPFTMLVLSELFGWRGRRQGRLIAALRSEIATLRSLVPKLPPDHARSGPEVVATSLPSRSPSPVVARRPPTDGSGCVAGRLQFAD